VIDEGVQQAGCVGAFDFAWDRGHCVDRLRERANQRKAQTKQRARRRRAIVAPTGASRCERSPTLRHRIIVGVPMRSGFGFDHMVIRRHVLAVLALDTACLQARAAAKTRNDRSAKENDRGEERLKPQRAKSVPEALRAVKPGGPSTTATVRRPLQG